MPPKELVLVLGAGASYEYGFPTGEGLTQHIRKLVHIPESHESFSNISIIAQHINQRHARNTTPHHDACRAIAQAMPLAPSIDNFIDSRRGDALITQYGKMAIVNAIMECESKSTLLSSPQQRQSDIVFGHRSKHSFNYTGKEVANSWYRLLFTHLVKASTHDEFTQRLSTMAVITFNYDRSFEYFLVNAIQTYYQVSISQAIKTMSHLDIHHVYGSIGNPFPTDDGTPHLDFGTQPTRQICESHYPYIKTFTEGAMHNNLHDLTLTAKRLVFLGFSYLNTNLNVLFGRDHSTGTAPFYEGSIYGTCLGMSPSDQLDVQNHLAIRANIFGGNSIHLQPSTCADFIKNYSRMFS